jgi:hypothetical protein
LPHLNLLFRILDRGNLVDAAQAPDNPVGPPQPVAIGLPVKHHLQYILVSDRLRSGKSAQGGDIPRRGFELGLSEWVAEGWCDKGCRQGENEEHDGQLKQRETALHAAEFRVSGFGFRV